MLGRSSWPSQSETEHWPARCAGELAAAPDSVSHHTQGEKSVTPGAAPHRACFLVSCLLVIVADAEPGGGLCIIEGEAAVCCEARAGGQARRPSELLLEWDAGMLKTVIACDLKGAGLRAHHRLAKGAPLTDRAHELLKLARELLVSSLLFNLGRVHGQEFTGKEFRESSRARVQGEFTGKSSGRVVGKITGKSGPGRSGTPWWCDTGVVTSGHHTGIHSLFTR